MLANTRMIWVGLSLGIVGDSAGAVTASRTAEDPVGSMGVTPPEAVDDFRAETSASETGTGGSDSGAAELGPAGLAGRVLTVAAEWIDLLAIDPDRSAVAPVITGSSPAIVGANDRAVLRWRAEVALGEEAFVVNTPIGGVVRVVAARLPPLENSLLIGEG